MIYKLQIGGLIIRKDDQYKKFELSSSLSM